MVKQVSPLSPLFVDLDGTFIKSDMLFESLLVALKANPFIIFLCLFWLLQGKSQLKYKLSQRAEINPRLVPLNSEFCKFLYKEKDKGRKIILATASSQKYASDFCSEYDLFDSSISSDQHNNLKGKSKLSKIQSLTENFAYAGNSSEDFVIFEHAQESYLVAPTKKAQKMSLNSNITERFDDNKLGLIVWIKQLRLHQWLKNLLIFVPLLVSGQFLITESMFSSLLGFISFGCLASATYIINDLLDLDSDRSHARKKFRPLAAGQISIVSAIVATSLLFIASFAITLIKLEVQFFYVLLAYLAITLSYSFKVKRYIGLDVLTLASLYTIRILAGAAILNVVVSFWLLSFSMFIFLSLALVKRCGELKSLADQNTSQVKGRDYNTNDYNVLMNLGTSSAMLSVLMFCFYVNSNVLNNQYQEPTILWLIVPALCYWLMRMWVDTNRGKMHDDPIIYSLRDRGSLITIGFIGIVALMAQLL
jgi:4-hydroxybenzoate polyprenyltransferase